MKSSAAFLSDNVICLISDHQKLKTFILKDSTRIEVFEKTIFFEKGDPWIVHVDHQIMECRVDSRLLVNLNQVHVIEISLFSMNRETCNPGILSLQDEVIIGSDYVVDGIVDARFEAKELKLKKDGHQVAYEYYGKQTFAINGNISSKSGFVSIPSLIECGPLKVFVSDQNVVFNFCILANLKEPLVKHQASVQQIELSLERYNPIPSFKMEKIQLPEYPKIPEAVGLSLMSIGPMLTMSCASFLTAWISYQNTGNRAMLIMPSMMIFSAVFWPIVNAVIQKIHICKLKKERMKNYVSSCEVLIDQIKKMKQDFTDSFIRPDHLSLSQYWQIRNNHPQFLMLPLGYTTTHLPVEIQSSTSLPDFNDQKSTKMLNELKKYCDVHKNVLMSVDLNEYHHFAIICLSKLKKRVANAAILSLCSMMDLKSVHYVLFCDDENISWHFRTTSCFQYGNYSTVLDSSVSVYHAQRILKELLACPVICFVLDLRLYRQIDYELKKRLKVIFLLNKNELIPSECQKVYCVSSEGMIEENQIQMLFWIPSMQKHRIQILKKLRPVFSPYLRSGTLDYLSLFPDLSEMWIEENWKTQKDPAGILGVGTNEEIIRLNLSEHHEGPHGLVAGMTGSGKSSLLLGFLLSLAVENSPEDLQILIIDYKGGSLFHQLQFNGMFLPHLCGWLSNHSEMIARTLSTISYECTRRQKMFEQASVVSGRSISSIQEYRTIRKTNSTLQPLANLLIVVDEFAELKKEEPQFMKTLISLSRVGRSLGIHLILSTQKCSGVVDDEIMGNTRFKLLLRVSRASESREMIGCEDASYLKNAGEFILKSDQRTIKGKSAYSLAPVKPTDDHLISIVNSCGTVLKSSSIHQSEGIRQNELLIEMMKRVSDKTKKKASLLWRPPLIMKNALSLLKSDRIFLGVADFPETRSQKALYLHSDHHLLIGFQSESQRLMILQYYLKQVLMQEGNNVYYVQLITKLKSEEMCIGPDEDQMNRWISKMSKMQSKKTYILVDDLVEWMESFESVSHLIRFLFKALQRKIRVIAMVRFPLPVSSVLLDQFASKIMFAPLNDSECMNLFHSRRDLQRITSSSQGYTLVEEKLCVLQQYTLDEQLEEKNQLKTVQYLSEVMKIGDNHHSIGISVHSLLPVCYSENESMIFTGVQKSELLLYAQRLGLEHQVEILDSFELSEKYTRKSIREKSVLWIGPQFQMQMMFLYEPKMKVPKSYQEGVWIEGGFMELVRLYDE